jgi:G3E family GTPase
MGMGMRITSTTSTTSTQMSTNTSTTPVSRRSVSRYPPRSTSTHCRTGSPNYASSDASQLFRMKGILAVRGQPCRYVLQGVHNVIELRAAQAWG